ncbi:MAG: hypothetical protein ACI94Y_004259 [Maribacter sp.]|jgi:hypothetical protein
MGVGKEIVNLGFGLTLGAIVVVVSLWIGGREAAGKHMTEILASFKKNRRYLKHLILLPNYNSDKPK